MRLKGTEFDQKVQWYYYYFSRRKQKFHKLKEELNLVYVKALQILTLYMKDISCCCLLCDWVVNPHSLYRFSNNALNTAGCFILDPLWCLSSSEYPSNTTDAYSTTGNIYIWLRAFLLINYLSLRIIQKILVAELTVSLSLSHWYPGSGVVLDCIDSWS